MYRRTRAHERSCGRGYIGVDHPDCGLFGPTICRDVCGYTFQRTDWPPHCRHIDWIPVPACPPLQEIEIVIQDAGNHAAELKDKIIGPNAKKLPDIKLPGYELNTPIDTAQKLDAALRVQNKSDHAGDKDHIKDGAMQELGDKIAEKISDEVSFPGIIKVNLIRRTKAVDYAKEARKRY